MITHSFADKLAQGTKEEVELDSFFSKQFIITPVSYEQQRQGIDRVFLERNSPMCLTVEYKADFVAARTGNAFIELLSVDKDGKPGWAYTSQAQILAYYIPPTGEVIMVDMMQLKLAIPAWERTCQKRVIPNRGKNGDSYNTIGLLVPLQALRNYSIKSLWAGR